MDTSTRAIIIHGAYGSPVENWFPWLREQIQDLGFEAIVPTLPTPDGQSLENWTKLFAAQCGPLTTNTLLVGHSLAAAFILSLLEASASPIKGTFLVSGFLGPLGLQNFDSINESFTCREFNWEIIRRNAGRVRVYNSDTDPYVPLEKGRELARQLKSDLIVIANGGHINASAGFTRFPQLFEDVKTILLSK